MQRGNQDRIPKNGRIMIGLIAAIVAIAIVFIAIQYRAADRAGTLSDGVSNGTQTYNHSSPSDNDDIDNDEVIKWYETSINKLEKRVDELEKKAIVAGDDVKGQYQETLTVMEQELDTLRLQLKQVRAATKDNWDALKTKVDETRARIDEKLKNDAIDYSASVH